MDNLFWYAFVAHDYNSMGNLFWYAFVSELMAETKIELIFFFRDYISRKINLGAKMGMSPKYRTNINKARAILLMELCEKIYIDIGANLYTIIAETTKTTSRAKLVLPSLVMRILHENGVETPQHISLMTSSPSINSQTILRSRVRLPGDEKTEEPVVVEVGAEHHHLHQFLPMPFRS